MKPLIEGSFKTFKQVNKLSLRLLSVRLLSFVNISMTFRPFIAYNCQRYSVPDVKICSISIVRNVLVSPAKSGLAMYILNFILIPHWRKPAELSLGGVGY